MLAGCCPASSLSLSLITTVACHTVPLSMLTAEHGSTRRLHYIRVCLRWCSTPLTQSLSTISQLTVEELVHLHNPGCVAHNLDRFSPSLCSLSSGDGARSQFCVADIFADSETQTESAAIPSDAGTSAPLYIHSICIRYRHAGQFKETHTKEKQGLLAMQSSRGEGTRDRLCCTRNACEISPLHWFGYLTVQMLHLITIQMCTDCCTTEGDCIVLAADAVLRSRWDNRNNVHPLIG